MERHPTTRYWRFPPPDWPPLPAGARRTNLRELAARPGRLPHHLMVVARVGGAQLELATAGEPLYFAHHNVSDEWAMVLPSGDADLDAMPLRTFVMDDQGKDIVRYAHRAGDFVLHPLGWRHWPGRLRDPYAPFAPPGPPRSVLSIVLCASAPCEGNAASRVSAGREGDVKREGDAPAALIDTAREAPGEIASVAGARLRIATDLRARGDAYAIVLDASGAYFPGDLLFLPEGSEPSSAGIARALILEGAALAPPASWDEVPAAPFDLAIAPSDAPYHLGRSLELQAISPVRVEVRSADASATIPRYWLARTLLRIALHSPGLGCVETYGGFFFDDRGPRPKLGVRGVGWIELEPARLVPEIARMHRHLAPPGFAPAD